MNPDNKDPVLVSSVIDKDAGYLKRTWRQEWTELIRLDSLENRLTEKEAEIAKLSAERDQIATDKANFDKEVADTKVAVDAQPK